MSSLLKFGVGVLAGAVAASGVMIAQAGDSDPGHYTVGAADTWQSIAVSHGVTADVLQVANNVAASTADGAHPGTGWILHIPEVASSASTTTTTVAPATTTTAPAVTTSTTQATTTSISSPATSTTTSQPGTTTSSPAVTTTTMPPMNHDCPGMSYTPLGAIPPATPMFCMTLAEGVPTTVVIGANSWVDDFQHGGTMAAMGRGYREFTVDTKQAKAFRHNQHWMPDVLPNEGQTTGGHYLRPDRSFRFVNGVLVVEMDVAAGIEDYDQEFPNEAWPEIVVSTGAAPVSQSAAPPDPGYAMGRFPGEHTVGIRLHAFRMPIAAYFNDSRSTNLDVVRTWEKSFFQTDGARQDADSGGPFTAQRAAAWRTCNDTDPDTNCRDRFRWELRKDSITLYVNGVLYWRQTDLPAADQLSDEMVNGDVYVYAASWLSTTVEQTYRFHWDRFAVNP